MKFEFLIIFVSYIVWLKLWPKMNYIGIFKFIPSSKNKLIKNKANLDLENKVYDQDMFYRLT